MKRLLLGVALLGFCYMASAQSPSVKQAETIIPKVNADITLIKKPTMTVGGAIVGPVKEKRERASDCNIGEVIGETTYDLQTNSATSNRLLPSLLGGDLYTAWTGSTELTTTWTDRGGFYNTAPGGTWGTAPTSREETIRTGWPALVHISSGEIMFSHDPSAFGYTVMNKRSTKGSGSWTEDKTALNGIWPRAVTGDPTSNIVHVITSDYQNMLGNNYMMYHRSLDGGTTFDITDSVLVGIDSITGGYRIMGGDAYAIDARGGKVAIAAGNTINDWAVWTSNDTGNTWTRTRVLDFPIDNFKGEQITDTNGDMSVDTLLTTAADHCILIDNGGKVHAWVGAMRIMDTDPAVGSGWNFFPGTGGLFYWNEDMGPDSFQTIAITDDVDGDGTLGGIGRDVTGSYGIGLVGVPTASVDPTSGSIYVTFMGTVEYSDVIEDPTDASAQSFRDIYGMYTTNGGMTWTGPFNLTRTACNWEENAFPMSFRYTTGTGVMLQWMTDEEPGVSVGTNADHSVTTNEIIYKEIPYTDFATYNPVADFTCVTNPDNGFTIFTNKSCQTDCAPGSWTWDFDDGTPDSDLREPTHTFALGTYNVCLTVTNRYGSDMFCKMVTVTGIEELNLDGFVNFFPNPTQDILNIEISNREVLNADVVVYNAIGQEMVTMSDIDITSANTVKVDMSELDGGVYFVQISNENGQFTKAVTLQK